MRYLVGIHGARSHFRRHGCKSLVHHFCSVSRPQAAEINRATENCVAGYWVCGVPTKFAATVRQFVSINPVFTQAAHCLVQSLLFLELWEALKSIPCAH